jgi:2-hydroxychromene-2-carboxylate isomerase
MKTIHYFAAPQSPWTYLGHRRLGELASRHSVTVLTKPFDLGGKVFPQSGGLPLGQRAPQRQSYRLVDLQRWADFLQIPFKLHPKFFPVSGDLAAKAVIAAQAGGFALCGKILEAVWARDLNIADSDVLRDLAQELGLNGAQLVAQAQNSIEVAAQYEAYTQEAIKLQVFGAPWYQLEHRNRSESFWGQDRLEFLERAVAASADQP